MDPFKSELQIIKSDGSKTHFDPEKLRSALFRSGASEEDTNKVLQIVESKLYEGVSTKNIYDYAYKQLKLQKAHRTAGRYRLKKAIFDLGPSGYPFEIFVGKLFESFGYTTQVGQIIQGKCVQHEVDVVAQKDNVKVIVETKFRGDFRGKTTVQVPLYINSRFADIKAKWCNSPEYKDIDIQGYVVTNTRFTVDAIKYAECVGLGLISWDYPADGSLKKYIDESGLHPLTSLHKLRKTDKKFLLEKGIVLCSELYSHQELLSESGLNERQIKAVLKEAETLIGS